MFEGITDGLTNAFSAFRGTGKITEANIHEGMKQVRKALLEADVAYDIVQKFVKDITAQAVGEKVLKSLRPDEQIVGIVHQGLIDLMSGDHELPIKANGITIIMMCGLQGSGKTTTCGKLSVLLKQNKITPLLVAADLQRPAAIDQLHVIGEQLGVPVYSDKAEKDPIKVCRAAVNQANENGNQVVS